MYVEPLDYLAKACVAVGSRRWVMRGLLGSLLGLSGIGAARANHKTGHHCAPSDKHPCPSGKTCREVSGEWTCQDTCRAPGEPCTTDYDCCPINGIWFCIPDIGVCDNDPGTD
jgi:hypothetical protein